MRRRRRNTAQPAYGNLMVLVVAVRLVVADRRFVPLVQQPLSRTHRAQYANLKTVSSSLCRMLRFSFFSQVFIAQAPAAVAIENAALEDMAMV
jgi:hypothetical protein